jgi:hypothetical protein
MTEENRIFYEAQLKAEVVVLTEMLRIMSEKITELEKQNAQASLNESLCENQE